MRAGGNGGVLRHIQVHDQESLPADRGGGVA